jgi:hypothetical protein
MDRPNDAAACLLYGVIKLSCIEFAVLPEDQAKPPCRGAVKEDGFKGVESKSCNMRAETKVRKQHRITN